MRRVECFTPSLPNQQRNWRLNASCTQRLILQCFSLKETQRFLTVFMAVLMNLIVKSIPLVLMVSLILILKKSTVFVNQLYFLNSLSGTCVNNCKVPSINNGKFNTTENRLELEGTMNLRCDQGYLSHNLNREEDLKCTFSDDASHLCDKHGVCGNEIKCQPGKMFIFVAM